MAIVFSALWLVLAGAARLLNAVSSTDLYWDCHGTTEAYGRKHDSTV